MENTNENFEKDALDSSVLEEIAQLDERPVEDSEPTEQVTDDDDATMSVLKRFPKVCARIAKLMDERAEEMALDLIHKGLDYDDAVANADKEGYVRGRNEKIELVKGHRMPQLDDAEEEETDAARVMFPRYGKKSVWES